MSGAQRGQALTEFIVSALVLVPLFLLIPIIAKYQDIRHATQMASRYVAFEATTRNHNSIDGFKPPGELAAEVARRFYSTSDAPIKTGDTAGDFDAHRNPFWVDQHGDPLIKSFGTDLAVSFGPDRKPAHTDAFTAASDGEPFELSPLNVRSNMELPNNGIYTGNVSVTLANLPSTSGSWTKAFDEFTNINLSMTRHTSVLIDGWGASEPAQVVDRIDKPLIVPGTVLKPLTPVLDIVVGLGEAPRYAPGICTSGCGPRLGELDYWRDEVPLDRLR